MTNKIQIYRRVIVAALLLAGGLAARSYAAQPKSKAPQPPPVVEQVESMSTAQLEHHLQGKPADVSAHLQAAHRYAAQSQGMDGRLDEAKRHADEALKVDPSNVEARMLAGEIAMRKGDLRMAVYHYQQVVQTNPNNSAAYLALGGAFDQLGQEADANAAYAKFRALLGMPPLQRPDAPPAK